MTCLSCQWPSAPFSCKDCDCHFCESCFDGARCFSCAESNGDLTSDED